MYKYPIESWINQKLEIPTNIQTMSDNEKYDLIISYINYITKVNYDNILDFDENDHIKLGKSEKEIYKFRYYEYNFNTRINQKEFND